jgi:hypothetical protein
MQRQLPSAIGARMRRAALVALVATVALVMPLRLAHAAHRSRVPTWVCRIDWRAGPREVKQLIWCAAKRWPVPGGPLKAIDVARCESHFDPSAYSNGNAGVYQQRVKYWPGRARTYGFPGWSVFNGRANVIVSIRMAHRNGWGAWSCA